MHPWAFGFVQPDALEAGPASEEIVTRSLPGARKILTRRLRIPEGREVRMCSAPGLFGCAESRQLLIHIDPGALLLGNMEFRCCDKTVC